MNHPNMIAAVDRGAGHLAEDPFVRQRLGPEWLDHEPRRVLSTEMLAEKIGHGGDTNGRDGAQGLVHEHHILPSHPTRCRFTTASLPMGLAAPWGARFAHRRPSFDLQRWQFCVHDAECYDAPLKMPRTEPFTWWRRSRGCRPRLLAPVSAHVTIPPRRGSHALPTAQYAGRAGRNCPGTRDDRGLT